MAEKSLIGWCDHSLNLWIGCSKISPGCSRCYADRDFGKDSRFNRAEWGVNGTRSMTTDANWLQAVNWSRRAERISCSKKPLVFVNSLADFFEDFDGPIINHSKEQLFFGNDSRRRNTIVPESVDRTDYPVTMDDMRKWAFDLFDATPFVNYLLLTKRPENIRKMWAYMSDMKPIFPGSPGKLGEPVPCYVRGAYRSNVFLGTSVENQEYAEERIQEHLKCRDLSPVLFLSAEPLLGSIDLRQCKTHEGHKDVLFVGDEGGWEYAGSRRNFINWVIVGAESGKDRRPAKVEWLRSIRDQCVSAGVPFFMKQMEVKGKMTTSMDDFPEDLRIQEYPNGSR